jgi:hypothetical protein
MDAVRDKWTDERLDDLNGKVDDLGRRMNLRFDAIDLRFDAIDRRFEGVGRRFEGIEGRIDRLTWVMTTTMVTGFLTLAGLIVSQG